MTSFDNSESLLPTYAPSAPSPSYTYEPTDDEHTLQHTPTVISPPPTSTYTKESERVVVTLFEQEKDIEMPTYGRRAHISGTVYCENVERVFQVVLKVRLKLTLWDSSHSFPRLKAP
jgi:hypothetical protein